MAIVVDRTDVDALTGWPRVEALRALASMYEARATSARGAAREEMLYFVHELTDEANKLSTALSGVECITTYEACIRELLAGSSYCHVFKIDECLSVCEKHGIPPTSLPSIVDELNRRRAHMDCMSRLAHHIVAENMPTSPPVNQGPVHMKRGIWSRLVDALLHIVYFLSPILVIFALVVVCMPYVFFEWLLGVRQGFSFVALCLTVAFWIILLFVLSATPWKKLRPNRQWLIVPIRHLRKFFRHLEADSRP